MGDMVQYAALGDLESVVKELAKITGKPVAIVFDPKHGWCLTDEVIKGPSKHGGGCPQYTAQTYQDWFSKTIGEAALVTFGARFLPGTLIGRLFRKQAAYPTPAVEGGEKGAVSAQPGSQVQQAQAKAATPQRQVTPTHGQRQAAPVGATSAKTAPQQGTKPASAEQRTQPAHQRPQQGTGDRRQQGYSNPPTRRN